MAKAPRTFEDTVVIYKSSEDGCWIAHSLRTDQIGTGDRIVDALADVLRAVDEVRQLAQTDRTVAFFREAPADIQALSDGARQLPKEIFEVAFKKVHGNWPEEFDIEEKLTSGGAFTTKVSELVC